ncbi:MAG: efflux transporter outer membrane subunit [Bacteroides sp.]|nr:efflux transporter outer membrane subunit [Bacteroides sp.]
MNRFNRIICLSAMSGMLLMLGGCGLYSNYKRPDMADALPEITLGHDSVATPLYAMSWRSLLTDSALVSLIERGLANNTDLRIAQLKVDEAAATLSASRLALLPSVGISADGKVAKSSPSTFTVTPTASWEIDIFGRQRNLRKSAEAAFYGSMAFRQAVQTALIASIADGYYTLLMLEEQLSISERTLTTWDENIRALQAFKRTGRTNEAAVLQARANRMQVENSILTLRKQILVQENSLKSLILDPRFEIKRGKLREQKFPEALSGGINVAMLSARPDVLQAEYQLQKSFYGINVARAAFYPSLTLSGSAGWTTSSGSSVANPSSWIANAIGSLAAPIFSRGTNEANLRIARAEYEIASLQFQQTLLDAGMEVNNAISAWQTAEERIAIDKKQIVTLKGAVHSTRLLMRNTGTTNYLTVLTAQQRLLDAELTEVNDRYMAIQSVIALYHALGGGVD